MKKSKTDGGPLPSPEAEHIHVLTFHQRRFVVGLVWQTIRAQRNPMKEIRRVGKERGLDLVAVRQSDSIQAGFAPKTRLRLRGAYSLTVALSSLLRECCIAVVPVGTGPDGVARYTLVGRLEKGGIHPFSDQIYTEDELPQKVIDLKDELRGSRGNLDIPVYGALTTPGVTRELNFSAVLEPSSIKRQFRLRPLTWGMTRGQLIAAGCVAGIALAGALVWLHIEHQREEEERLARLRQIAHQEEVNRQARYKAALDGLKHPWTEQPSVATFISHCRGMLDKIPLSIVGWMTTNVMCMPDQVSVQSLRRTNSAATTAAYVAAVKELFGVTAEFNFKNSSLTSFTLRQTLPPEGDDPMVPVGERLMNFISLFQALNIDLGVSSVPIKDVKENKEGEKLPLQDWQSYTFSASTDITPELIFPGNQYTGIRLSSIAIDINTSSGSNSYKISGTLYGKRNR
ncbi:pilin accessory protein (PilO) [Pantoea allii]|uniref:Pilin accessory protein (PilO) n=1 Tax=Pantoea allii TaxID=574096 RepID=A0A2V2BFU1_9GAMM|nr:MULTISPECIES: type 4b pilus protein PilO2 [Pantoea]OWY74706.1 conjugal transfer protein [Pantoea sp. AMG 501]PWK94535.1 pilin accessory protein (PilO) [Pantoea allii]